MDRINAILHNQTYKECMRQITINETDRRFCLHGLPHSMDVARVAMLYNLEEQLGLEKEQIYAAALLHDIGRAETYRTGEEHHVAGARYAEQILKETGFPPEAREEIIGAIRSHNTTGREMGGLAALLYRADKESRLCFDCDVYEECYWKEEAKNKGIRW